MIKVSIIISLFTVSILGVYASEKKLPDFGKTFEFYTVKKPGGDFQVKLVRIGDKKNEEVLIKYSGIDDTLSGRTYKYKKQWLNSDKSLQKWRYCTKEIPEWKGKNWCPLHSNSQWGYASMKFFLYDDEKVGLPVVSESGYKPNLDPIFFYKQYQKQLKAEANKK